ncbi:reverse transcriptase [Plakobranchus ocellatus]|uniref:Reverse transcriptase n=1 Tax=Plakobranchus ocellatus TaxID=259542 RepID=A0AAV4C6D5_9GAST|nr:reverse transcriptase [Plakobranchus ocellatus]
MATQNANASQTEMRPEEANESNTCRRTGRSSRTVARFEGEEFSQREKPLEDIEGLIWPSTPGIQFNKSPTLDDVNTVIKRQEVSPSALSSIQKMSKCFRWLQQILRSAWNKLKISEQLTTAEGVIIPKEENSTEINQFQRISLLNVKRKIFSAMISHLTKYLTENGYVSVSVQKRGFPGISGCLEHIAMICEAI